MTQLFISKKRRAEIRARRRKKTVQDRKEPLKTNNDDDGNHRDDTDTDAGTGAGAEAGTDHIQIKSTPINGNESGKKRKREDVDGPISITVPEHFSSKEAKKFRKEERRKARKKGLDETSLIFIHAAHNHHHQQPMEEEPKQDESNPPKSRIKSKSKSKSFPRINELLQKAEEANLKRLQLEKLQQRERSIPQTVKDRHVALDCEMVGIGTGGKQSALARVSITGWDGNVLLDTFVQVPDRVTDFRTFVSGVRAKDIRPGESTKGGEIGGGDGDGTGGGGAMELHACRKKVGDILSEKILVGHALRNDFAALMLDHPKPCIRDTAKYRPFMRPSGRNGGKWKPRKLRDLVKQHLDRDIQVEGQAHSSVEDAKATMDLYKLVREKWEKDISVKNGAGVGGSLPRSRKKTAIL